MHLNAFVNFSIQSAINKSVQMYMPFNLSLRFYNQLLCRCSTKETLTESPVRKACPESGLLKDKKMKGQLDCFPSWSGLDPPPGMSWGLAGFCKIELEGLRTSYRVTTNKP